MAKKKNLEDIYYPVPKDYCPMVIDKPPINSDVIRKIIQGTVKGAFGLKDPSTSYYEKPKYEAVATEGQINMVMHLIESLQPKDAIEAALASQFAITYIRGLNDSNDSSGGYGKVSSTLNLFEFGHQVLEALQKYRSKGAQLISVNYNHNQGQINNINVNKKDGLKETIEVI